MKRKRNEESENYCQEDQEEEKKQTQKGENK